jgi:hypothetical protein
MEALKQAYEIGPVIVPYWHVSAIDHAIFHIFHSQRQLVFYFFVAFIIMWSYDICLFAYSLLSPSWKYAPRSQDIDCFVY